jgi:hypothetical protein
MNRRMERVEWRETGDPHMPWEAAVRWERWRVRLNDFPDECLYSLLVDGVVVEEFNDWPAAWERPGSKSDPRLPSPSEAVTTPDDPHEQAEYEREAQRTEGGWGASTLQHRLPL